MTDRQQPRRELRRRMRAAREAAVAALALPVRRALEQALADRLLPYLGAPGILGSHAAVGSEIDPAAVEAGARRLGWRIAYPRVGGAHGLSFHEADRAALVPGHAGIPEPPADAPAVQPDCLLVPLLAADPAGNRLGQGGGHYDRALAWLRAAGTPLVIGIGWDVQMVDALAVEPWDQPLDALATPTSFRRAARSPISRP